MLVHKVYVSEDGTRFYIHGRKQKPSGNGFDFIAENLKSGVIAYFNHKGEHAWHQTWKLKVDPYKWCGVLDGDISPQGFVPKEELLEGFTSYLRMENNDPLTIVAVSRKGLEQAYA